MADQIADFFTGIPAHWITFFLAMLPVSELRGAIPWAMLLGGLNWQNALLWSISGNLIPIIPLLLLLGPLTNLTRRIKMLNDFFNWLFARTRRKGKIVQKFEFLGLIILVAIPLPGTGAWTGALAAFVFGVRFALALPAIIIGVVIAGALVTSMVVSGTNAAGVLFGL